ncbi:MAG: helix-turn-helix transcriptional regulator [Treponema sp.]|nr:helix-turn-helix transcriptional regulator [Treponema sp.]
MSVSVFGGFYKKDEEPGFCFSHPHVSTKFTFLHFYDPVIISLNGINIQTDSDACIIFRSGTPQFYKAVSGELIYDYIKFEADEDFFFNVDLPFDEIFYISVSAVYKTQMKFITWALTEKMTNQDTAIGLACANVMSELSEIRKFPTSKIKRENDLNFKLFNLRKKVMQNPEKWNVNLMSDDFGLTRSHFTNLYKERFGISPADDIHTLLDAKAKNLLETTEMTVNEIAEACGYTACENFIRSFKKSNGVSPLQFRRKKNPDA